MDLRQEVAQFATQLGFRPKLYSNDGGVNHHDAIKGSTSDTKEASRTRKNVQKEAPSERSRVKKSKKSTAPSNKKKSGDKLDNYDKKALLEILSGPDESSTAAAKIRGMHGVFF